MHVSDKWSPALQIRTVLLSIQALLSAPNPDDPLANDVAEQWKLNESQAIDTGIGLHKGKASNKMVILGPFVQNVSVKLWLLNMAYTLIFLLKTQAPVT